MMDARLEYPLGIPHDVCQLFEELALQVRKVGYDRYSADAILHRIRWTYQVERGHRDFKCNNNWTPMLARWLMKKRPDMYGFFELRVSRADAEIWLKSTPLNDLQGTRTMRTKDDMRAYQWRTVTRMYESPSLLAVLKMGAGKTISALTAIQELIRDGHIRHALVLAPKRVAELVWKQEAAGWEHTRDLRVDVLTGSPRQRKRLLHEGSGHVTVCGIDNAQWLAEELGKMPPDAPIFDLLVIDETSRFKDPKSKRGKALRPIVGRFRNRWGMTGTPRPNDLQDLWGPMQLLTAEKLWPRSFYKWQRDHFRPKDYNGYTWEVLPGHDETIMAEVAPFAMTLGEDEMPDLPELTIIEEEVELPPEARRDYDSMERKLFAGDVVAVSAAVATGKLAQIANGYVYGENGVTSVIQVHDVKRQWLQEKLDDLDGEPALIVYEFLEDRNMIRDVIGDIPFLGSGISDAAARAAIEAWDRRELPYLGLHPASGGHGLNLQRGGARQLWISPPWSSELWDQTLARSHRPGQHDHVMIHVCCARSTVDQLKRSRVIGKLTAQQAFETYLRGRGLKTMSSAER